MEILIAIVFGGIKIAFGHVVQKTPFIWDSWPFWGYTSVRQTGAILNHELRARCGEQDLYDTNVIFGHQLSSII